MKQTFKHATIRTGIPAIYMLAAGICLATALGGCINEMEVEPTVADGTPVRLVAEIESSATSTKAAVEKNTYDRSSFIAGDKIRIFKSNVGAQQADYTLSANGLEWQQPASPVTLQAGARYKAVYPADDLNANYIQQNQQTAENFRKSNKLVSGEITSRNGILEFTGDNAFSHAYTKLTLTFVSEEGMLTGSFENTLITAKGLYTNGDNNESISLFRPDPDTYSWCGIVYPKKTSTTISLSLKYGGVTYKTSIDCDMQPGKNYSYTLTIKNGILVPSGSTIEEWMDDINSGNLTDITT